MDVSTSHERGKSKILTACGTTVCFVDFWGQIRGFFSLGPQASPKSYRFSDG